MPDLEEQTKGAFAVLVGFDEYVPSAEFRAAVHEEDFDEEQEPYLALPCEVARNNSKLLSECDKFVYALAVWKAGVLAKNEQSRVGYMELGCDRIAREIGFSPSQVLRSLSWLQEVGLISRDLSNNSRPKYTPNAPSCYRERRKPSQAISFGPPNGARIFKDGSSILKDGSSILYNAATILKDGSSNLYNGGNILKDDSSILDPIVRTELEAKENGIRTLNDNQPEASAGLVGCFLASPFQDRQTGDQPAKKERATPANEKENLQPCEVENIARQIATSKPAGQAEFLDDDQLAFVCSRVLADLRGLLARDYCPVSFVMELAEECKDKDNPVGWFRDQLRRAQHPLFESLLFDEGIHSWLKARLAPVRAVLRALANQDRQQAEMAIQIRSWPRTFQAT